MDLHPDYVKEVFTDVVIGAYVIAGAAAAAGLVVKVSRCVLTWLGYI